MRQALNLVDPQRAGCRRRSAPAVGRSWAAGLEGEVREARHALRMRGTFWPRMLAPPLAEWLRGAMKRSDNPLTRLAVPGPGQPRTRKRPRFAGTRAAAGGRSVRAWLREHGIADTNAGDWTTAPACRAASA